MKIEDEIEDLIFRVVLENAVEYDGKARIESVLSKIMGERPDLKKNIKDIVKLVTKKTNELNELSIEQQRRILQERWTNLGMEKKEEEQKTLPPLPNVDKYPLIITRFSPNPDCVLHIGSIRALIISHNYARIYKGKFYLRFEDTDPRLKKSVLKFYDLIRNDMSWLGCKWDEEFIQSDRLSIYYDYARKLIDIGGAYVCICDPLEFKNKLLKGKSCNCREGSSSEHNLKWVKMLDGTYKEGEAIVRVKTDLNHPNPAVRDWPALRIIDTNKYPHPRVGNAYDVWPLYNFACGIDDHLLKISHIIRGKEHFTNMVRQKYLYDYFGWDYPEAIHYGRLKIPGATLSKSKIMESIKIGAVTDFSDPRLATLIALRRRGIIPKTFQKIAIDIGPKPVDSTLSWENIFAINRKLVDKIANRYFFVCDPITLFIKDISKKISLKIPLHPQDPERGYRDFEILPTNNIVRLFVSRNDLEIFSNNEKIRLMGLFNIEIEEIEKDRIDCSFIGESHIDARKTGTPIIHWVPNDKNIKAQIVLPTMAILEGLAEHSLMNEKIDNIVQLVRFGFGRIDNMETGIVRIYYSHS